MSYTQHTEYLLYNPRKTRKANESKYSIIKEYHTDITGKGVTGVEPAEVEKQIGNDLAKFLFWSISGGLEDNFIDVNRQPKGVRQNESDIYYRAWYLSSSGPKEYPTTGPNNFITIEAFDLDINDIIHDDFIASITPDTSNELLLEANQFGTMDTTHCNEDVKAMTAVNFKNFQEWITPLGIAQPEHELLTVTQNSRDFYMATYQKPKDPKIRQDEIIALYVSPGVTVDGKGPVVLPNGVIIVQPKGPAKELITAIQLLVIGETSNKELKSELLRLAQDQLKIASEQTQVFRKRIIS